MAGGRRIIRDEDEDEEMQSSESEVEIEAEVEDGEDEEAGEEGDEEEEISDKEDELIEEEDGSDLEALSSPPPDGEDDGDEPPPQPAKLKIKLRLPVQSATTTNSPTPEGSVAKGPSRKHRSPRGSDIESEDSDDDDGSVSTPGGRVLTARQAVLANVVGASHVSLVEPPNPRKKKPLTELEMALKREETARKRKNLSEKKLEDEKAETINRLLKKQSRAKGKRNALSTAEDRLTGVTLNNAADEEEEVEEGSGAATPLLPTMYRWTSSIQSDDTDGKKMVLSFSVPTSTMPLSVDGEDIQSPAPMDVDPRPPKRETPICNVSGCEAIRKYRLVEDWQRGACSMEHLKQLESQGLVVRLI